MISEGSNCMVQGRIVWTNGDLFKGTVKTAFNSKTPIVDAAGQPMMTYGFGLAVLKSVLAQTGVGQPGEIWRILHEEAYKLFPSQQIPPGFSMKYKDGDGVDDKGVPFSTREGYAGHIVLACTTSLPIKFFRWENGQNFLINEGIKCGDYVNVQLSVKAHPAIGQGKAGLYVNPNAVQFLGFGKPIINTPSGDSIFGTQAPPMPAGASATPVAPAAGFIQPNYGVIPQHLQPAATATQGFPSIPAQALIPQTPAAPMAPQGYVQQAPAMPAPTTPMGMPTLPQFGR